MIASLVASLDCPDDDCDPLLRRIASREEFEVGRRVGHRLPLTLEAPTASSLEALTDWLRGLEGVVHVDVVFVNYE